MKKYVGNGTPFTMCDTLAGQARCFPRGLDIMAVLGSERAEAIVIEEGDTRYEGLNTSYDKQLKKLKSQFAGFNRSNWNRNLYWSWLYALKPLLNGFGDGHQTFMQTKAGQEKELQTSLASWAELRHDTILYAKQSIYTQFGECRTTTRATKAKTGGGLCGTSSGILCSLISINGNDGKWIDGPRRLE